MGIAPDHLEKIFIRFEQAGISFSEVSGLGLGLFISKQIIKAHEGSLWVESELDKGAKFIIELPLGSQKS
jgi:signal transduction histidine kinase